MEWMCSWCGAPHEENDPPCEHCGHGQFETSYVRRSAAAEEDATATTQWVCTSCERAHPKHSPPCSRCGNMDLEQRTIEVDPSELSPGSFLDLASRGHLALFAVALLGAAVLGLGVLGVADLPGLGIGNDGPDLPDAPGNATAVDGLDLATVEDDYLATIDGERSGSRLGRTDALDDLATFYNRWRVRSDDGGGAIPMEEVHERVPQACQPQVYLYTFEVRPEAYEPAAAPGELAARRTLERRAELATVSAARTGVDVHAAPDGRLYGTQFLC